MEVTIKIEGLDQLTEAVAMLGGAMAYFKGATADEAVKAVETVTAKKEEAPAEAPTNAKADPPKEAAKSYALEDLQVAAADLARSGKRDDLAAALSECGVDTLPQLPPEKYGIFADKLKALGAAL